MVNKLWYKEPHARSPMYDITSSREYIQKYIDLYCPEKYKVPEDITTDNLKEFLEIILKYYQLYLFDLNELINLGESINIYFHNAYFDDFPDTFYPNYPDTDRRSLALSILFEMNSTQVIMPEDVPTLIEYLNVPDDQIADMHDYIDNYFEQFDLCKRFREELSRFNLVSEQRKEAIENGHPIPIRPMGIELNSHRIQKLNKSQLLQLIKKLYNTESDNLRNEFSELAPTLHYNNIMTGDLFYYIKEKKFSPEKLLVKVQAKDIFAPNKAPCIVLDYNWESNDLSKLHPVDKKYYLSLGTVYQWLLQKRIDKIMKTIDPSDLPAYNDHDKVDIIAKRHGLGPHYVKNWIRANTKDTSQPE